MKTKFTRLTALLLAVLCFFGTGISIVGAEVGSLADTTIEDVKALLNSISYDTYLRKYESTPNATAPIVINGVDYFAEKTTAEGVKAETYDEVEALFTPDSGLVSWKVNIPSTAMYSINIEYYPVANKPTSIERIFKLNDKIPFTEARYLTLSKVWSNTYRITLKDGEDAQTYIDIADKVGIKADKTIEKNEYTNDEYTYIIYTLPTGGWTSEIVNKMTTEELRLFSTDIDGNEIRPTMEATPKWRSYDLKDVNGFYSNNYNFYFEEGEQIISLEAKNEPVAIKSITLYPYTQAPDYKDVSSSFANHNKGSDIIKIEAEIPNQTSSQTIYAIEDRTSAVTSPSDTKRTLLNSMGGDKWQINGQWIGYDFTVNNSGLYQIAARFKQDVLDGIFTSRAVYIYSEGVEEGKPGYYNGLPYNEAQRLRFNYSTSWQSQALSYADENNNFVPLEFYFKEGVTYRVEFEVTLGDMGEIVRQVSDSLNNINDAYLNILKLTGASPDDYRDYGFSRVMPDTVITLILESQNLFRIAETLAGIAGEKSANVATLEEVARILERMGKDEDEIARNLKQLKSFIGSMGTWLSDAQTQPLQLDYIVVQSSEVEMPKAEANFFQAFWHELSSFWQSFFRNYNRMGAVSDEVIEDQTIDVWLAYGRDQTQVIRNLINNDFTPDTGVLVNLKLVAGNTLLPSILSGAGPDVYIGVSEDTVINYAIRGALLPVEDYDGFNEIALDPDTREFNEAAMLVLGIEDINKEFHYYGLPETQNFPMMFLRTDILAQLDLEIPRTWDDVLETIPVLQTNNMQIGMPNDNKIFLYQMGDTLFADDGMRINLDSNIGLESFETMCNLFTMYSFPYKYDFPNRFRTGEMPIGIASYNGTYNHLTVFATEIKGMWQFVPLPGIERADGTINNVSVSSVSAISMINGCSNEQAAWEFLKWHSGADCQQKYSNEMVAILGPSAKHATANLDALAQLPWTTEEYKQLSKQFENLASIPNYPGSYIIGRYTKFAFLAAIDDKADPTTELRKYITTINKEITRKRAEFGLEVLDIGVTLVEKRLDEAKTALVALSSSDKTQYSQEIENVYAAINIVLLNIKASNTEGIDALYSSAEALKAADSAKFASIIKSLEDAARVLATYL